ncbi:sulfate ABC transporter permease [Vibrio paucivorans]
MTKWISLVVLLYTPLVSSQINITDSVRISGFGTFSAAKSNSSIPVISTRDITDDWCFDCDSTFGLQADWEMTPQWRTGLQLVKRPQDHFSSPKVERAFVEYSNDNISVQTGRLRIPIFIMSEYYYVSSAYPWLRLPVDVYSQLLGITHYEGAIIDYRIDLADESVLVLSPYVSTPTENDLTVYGQAFNIEADFSIGLTSKVLFEDNELRFAYLYSDISKLGFVGAQSSYRLKLYSIGLSYYWDNLHFQGETLLSQEFNANWYAGLDYLIGDWQPYLQYGQSRKNVESESYLLGVKYHLMSNFNFNLEWQRIDGRESVINGHFTQPQNPLLPIENSVEVVSFGLSFTF